MPCMVDEFAREVLTIRVARKLSLPDVVDVPADLVPVHGTPTQIRSGQGPEFVHEAVKGRLRHILQRQAAGRVAERRGVQRPPGGAGADRLLAPARQSGPAAFVPGISHADAGDGAIDQPADELGSRLAGYGPLDTHPDHPMGAGHRRDMSGSF